MKQFKEAGEAPEVRCDGTQGGRPLRREPPRSATRALRGRHAASAARLLARERRRDCGRPTRARAARAQTAPERLATKRGRALATCQRGVWGHAKAGFKAREDRVSPSANQMTQERGETGEKEEGTPNRAVMDGGTSLWLRHKGQLVPIPQAYRKVSSFCIWQEKTGLP